MKDSWDAHEVRVACFSCVDMPGAAITSSGCANFDGAKDMQCRDGLDRVLGRGPDVPDICHMQIS
ncbi:hypothetical protein LPU83_pLPU83d_1044 (plasmid) [Rhizobium favelukesii]|uniref:Uncharacterized protein n=1 Tax=Rhizobium favelukesii TaxID=348824 RepID=W6RNT8_9HYPH|nr:hypothetical protein LPU83_pLPU83d_1044 [Rhizobium favelukesii]